MQLIDELERRLEGETSLFQAQLLREDLARLERLRALARAAGDAASCVKSALRLGWTPGDLRTAELRPALDTLVAAVHAHETAGGGAASDRAVLDAWNDFHRMRMERLVGCLTTPVPKPVDRA